MNQEAQYVWDYALGTDFYLAGGTAVSRAPICITASRMTWICSSNPTRALQCDLFCGLTRPRFETTLLLNHVAFRGIGYRVQGGSVTMTNDDARYPPNLKEIVQNGKALLAFFTPAVAISEQASVLQPGDTHDLPMHALFRFDPQIMCEVILYIAEQLRQPSLKQIASILYLADKLHLTRYGRFITGDRYIAMEYGPVPSNVYAMLRAARTTNGPIADDLAPGFSVQDERIVIPHREPDLDWISDSERECLDETIAQFGAMSFRQLTEISHDEAWQNTERNREISLEAILTSIGNPAPLLEHLRNPNP